MADANPIRWLTEIEDIPGRAIDPLADEVMRRFNAAVGHQSSEMVNGKSLRTVLENCWNQINGIMSCEDKERMESLGVDAIINISSLKVGIATAYLNESLTSGGGELPWVISPTPRPSISQEAADEVFQEIKAQLFAGGFNGPEDMVASIRMAKALKKRREEEKAQKAADEMTSLIEDQCTEGRFTQSLADFIHDFCIYPYAVFTGPYITRAPKLIWGKNKPRLSTEVFPVFRAISPFDFCYSPDSTSTQNGTCVFTRTRWTRKELLDAAQLPAYLKKNVLEVLEKTDVDNDFDLNWLSHSPDDPGRDLALWSSNCSSIEVLTHYGLFSGRELSKYGISGLDDLEYYNTEIDITGYRVIRVRVNSDPRMNIRPVYSASFYRTSANRIPGEGICQRLRDIERAYQACLGYLMRNAANASAPLCEADYKRISQYMSDEDLGTIVPGTMMLVNSDAATANSPALRFFAVPSNMPAYTQLMELFMQLADRATNLPAQLHGEAVGSGALRTFRGMSLLQGSATKALHASVENIARGVFEPMGTLLYNYNMLYAEDPAVKGDTQIVVQGASGLLRKEMDKQTSLEILQLMGSVGAQLQGMINVAPVIGWCIGKLMESLGVPDDILKQMQQAPMMPPMPSQEGPEGNGVNPNPNPSPDHGASGGQEGMPDAMAGVG